MKKLLIAVMAAAMCFSAQAVVRHTINVPDIPGYITLKGDFHNHTVFSDGHIWPTTRIDEAFFDCLDVISITDHMDTRHRKMVKAGYFVAEKCDRNTSYKLAKKQAKKYPGIIVIHGGEVTRGDRLFPGHFNTHFISDAEPIAAKMESEDAQIKDKIEREETAIINGLKAAREQKAFIVWNHPNWEPQEPNEVTWHPIHERVYKAGLMDGIEIVNQVVGFSPEAFHFAMERDLTIVTGADCHNPMVTYVDYESGEFRPMTLIFAKERTEASVREALETHRTAVLCNGSVYGKEEYIRPLLDAALKITDVKVTGGKISARIENVSSIPVRIRKAAGSENVVIRRETTINPGAVYSFSAVPVQGKKKFSAKEIEVNYYIDNFQTDAATPLLVKHSFKIPQK